MRWIAILLCAALLLQTGYISCAAQGAVILRGEKVDPHRLKVGQARRAVYDSSFFDQEA